jgi:hypothetical protein
MRHVFFALLTGGLLALPGGIASAAPVAHADRAHASRSSSFSQVGYNNNYYYHDNHRWHHRRYEHGHWHYWN